MRGGATEGLFGRKGNFSIRGHILLYILIQLRPPPLDSAPSLVCGLDCTDSRDGWVHSLSHTQGSRMEENTRQTGMDIEKAAPVSNMPWVCILLFYILVVNAVKIIEIHLKPSKR